MSQILKLSPSLNRRQTAEILLTDLLIILTLFFIGVSQPKAKLAIAPGAVVFALNTLRLFIPEKVKQWMDWLIRYRYAAALVLFALLVLFQVHTSSAASYASVLPADPSVADSILFGQPRLIGSDEYVVQLPYYISQYYNGFEQISHRMSLSGQDMIIGYNAPVLNFMLLSKPQTWGYLLLGPAYGMSWYYCSKMILMCLASFELVRILTQDKYMGCFGCWMIAFAPSLQWLFSPHMFDIFLWGFMLFDLGYAFFTTEKTWQKWGVSILAVLALGAFFLGMFPSLQVPVGLLMVFLLTGCLVRDRDRIHWNKFDWIRFGVTAAAAGGYIAAIVWNVREPLTILQNTAYPGKRVSTGGNVRWYELFEDVNDPLFPFREPGESNARELSSFPHFGLLVYLYFPWLAWNLYRNHKKGSLVGFILFAAISVEMVFMIVGFPEWLAKITLFSYCNRMEMVYNLTALLLTLWSVHMIIHSEILWKWQSGLAVSLLYGAFYVAASQHVVYANYLHFQQLGYYLAVPAGLAFVFFLVFTSWNQLYFVFMSAWIAVAGLTVNPISTGMAAITDYPMMDAVREIAAEDPDGTWMSLSTLYTQNLMLANGAKVVNAVNFYPDLEKWERMEDTGVTEEVWNRYAHLGINLTDKPTTFEIVQPDYISVSLNPRDLEKWDVDYLTLTSASLPLLDKAKIKYEVLYDDPDSDNMIIELN